MLKGCFFLKYNQPDSAKQWGDQWVTKIRQKDQEYLMPSNKLYQVLIAPFKEGGYLSENLTIVPDEILNLVNFEALVTEMPETDRI